MRLLTFSSLYPSAVRPRHGIFVETRLVHLVRDCGVDARVIAPVPWFPSRADVFGRYATLAATSRYESRLGIDVLYPRYPMLPAIGVPLQPDSMAIGAGAAIRRLLKQGWAPQLIDAHYFYPDGVAAAKLAARLGVPLVITARGSDINELARTPYIRRRIVWAATRAAAVVAVSNRLKDALVALGVDREKVVVLRNGVDLERFTPVDRRVARARLGLPERTTLACVGNLTPEKGFALAIECLRHLDAQLLIVGEGPERTALHDACVRQGVVDRVTFMRTMPQSELPYVYSSADVLLLTSTREGWPNVVLESMACGTPVAAVDVGAVNEMITSAGVGRVVAQRNAEALAGAVRQLLSNAPSRDVPRRHAAAFDWRAVSVAQQALFQRCLADGNASASSCATRTERSAA